MSCLRALKLKAEQPRMYFLFSFLNLKSQKLNQSYKRYFDSFLLFMLKNNFSNHLIIQLLQLNRGSYCIESQDAQSKHETLTIRIINYIMNKIDIK